MSQGRWEGRARCFLGEWQTTAVTGLVLTPPGATNAGSQGRLGRNKSDKDLGNYAQGYGELKNADAIHTDPNSAPVYCGCAEMPALSG